MNSRQSNSILKKVLFIIEGAVLTLPVLLFLSIIWFFSVWNSMTVNELLYHIFSPLEGTGDSVIVSFITHCAIPAVIAWIIICITLYAFRNMKKLRFIIGVMAGILLITDVVWFLYKIGFYEYVSTISNDSSFIADNYVNPVDVEVRFPESKRNLLYIYLESMEVSYSDRSHGGYFDYNIIPELTDLAREGECFSGDKDCLNGAYSLPGTDWTIAGIIAQTAAVPTQVSRGEGFENGYYSQLVTLGDILRENGYQQYFMCGSDGAFAGRKEYLTAHGNYEVDDFDYAVQRGWVEADSKDDWGYTDNKLFAFAKQRLLEISTKDEPFNFTLLTVDTHFSGKVCELCDNKFGSITENVIACSNRQVTDFVRWVQQQEFYPNTTIVICGDHISMDSGLGEKIGEGYDRKTYTLYLNAPMQPFTNSETRVYTTMDQFPTTIAALGAEIEGNRLGLGTNLFSEEATLSEKYGIDFEKQEISKYSSFLEKLSGIEVTLSIENEEKRPIANTDVSINENNRTLQVRVSDLSGLKRKFLYNIEARYYSNGDRDNQKIIKLDGRNGIYETEISLQDISMEDFDLNIYYNETLGSEYQIYGMSGDLRLKISECNQYLDKLKDYTLDPDYSILITAVNHDAMNMLNEEQLESIRALGLSVEMEEGEHNSYCAVIHNGNIVEQLSKERAEIDGDLEDGASYHMISDWRTERSAGSLLELNGSNYAFDMSGLQIIVYDNHRSKIADRVCFNFVLDRTFRREEFEHH